MAAALVTGSAANGPGSTDWPTTNFDQTANRYSPLDQITPANVRTLQQVWSFHLKPAGFDGGLREDEAIPLVIGNTMYVASPYGAVHALDATTGVEKWKLQLPNGDRPSKRGLAYWPGGGGVPPSIIFGVLSGSMYSIKASDGTPNAGFGQNGIINLKTPEVMQTGMDAQYSLLSSPTIYKNLIIIGAGTGEGAGGSNAGTGPAGDTRAFDAVTGKLVWAFHTVPRPGEFGYETWPDGAWKTVGGANNWGEQSLDEKRGIIYVPTGSPKYNFYGGNRKGANLFGDCLIALDARTGKRLWHFQTVHHDIWDLDNNSAPQLTTIRKDGRAIDVVAVASKTGYLYVFDRVTGAPIWPIEEKPVPQPSHVPGEQVWPTQPIPTKPEPFSRQKFTADDVNPHILTPEQREEFKARIRKARNDGPFTPIGFDEVVHMPGNQGGSNWGSTAANPTDGTVYVIGFNVPTLIRLFRAGETHPGRGGGPPEVVAEGKYVTDGFGLFPMIANPPYTTLNAYDLNEGKLKWQIGLGDDPRLVAQGIKGTGAALTVKGGIIPTSAGLVFVTAADRKVHVYESATGKQVHEIALGGPTSGSPSMYELGGRQYLLVTTGPAVGPSGGGPTGLVAYALK
jgi:quinoprotein glucose dehydrogenase